MDSQVRNYPDLFISHASADLKAAEELVADLETAGLKCWLASRDVPVGGAYQVEIVNAIDRCRTLLLVFSDSSNRSEHVLRELELADQDRKPIYPVRIDRAEPSGGLKYLLANKQWVERRVLGDRLAETLVHLLRGANASPAIGDTPQPGRARGATARVAAGLFAVAIVAGAGWFAAPGAPIWLSGLLGRPGVKDVVVAATGGGTPGEVVRLPGVPERIPPEAIPPESREPPEVKIPPEPAKPANTGPIVLASAPVNAGALGEGVHLFRDCDICPVMAVVPAGRSLMGSPESEPGRNKSEGPQQSTAFERPFAAGRSEVSFDEWLACVAEGGCSAYRPGDYGWGYGRMPVINVSWNDAKAYTEWLSRKTGAAYRLLSEAEWEYAARGCASLRCGMRPFWFGAGISPARANYDWRYSYDASPKAQPLRHTVATDESEANPFGLFHVHGNVREWVEDCWNPSLDGQPGDGRARTTGDCTRRVLRGGSWSDEPKDLRVAARNWELGGERRAQIGFRVARELAR